MSLKGILFAIIACVCTTLCFSQKAETVTDVDSNVYVTVRIGNQLWMAENLRATRFNDGTPISEVTDRVEWSKLSTPGYCFYDNLLNPDMKKKWGALYNWHVVDPANPKKIAPEGWHVPTDVDWTTLENYLISIADNWYESKGDGNIAKNMASQTDWKRAYSIGIYDKKKPMTIGDAFGSIGFDLTKNNASGFSALPGGFRINFGQFLFQDEVGCWWSASGRCDKCKWALPFYRS